MDEIINLYIPEINSIIVYVYYARRVETTIHIRSINNNTTHLLLNFESVLNNDFNYEQIVHISTNFDFSDIIKYIYSFIKKNNIKNVNELTVYLKNHQRIYKLKQLLNTFKI